MFTKKGNGMKGRKSTGPCAGDQARSSGAAERQARSSASQDVARQLRDVRKSQGMTQESLAELVGTKKSNISRLESGRYNPSLDFLVKVAGGLGKQIQVKVK